MSLFAMLFLMQAEPPRSAEPSPSTPEEIVVTGQRMERLKRLRMTTKLDRRTGATHCVFKRRSGDRALDDAVCNAVLACVPKVKTLEEMRVCIAPTMGGLVGMDTPWQANEAKGGR